MNIVKFCKNTDATVNIGFLREVGSGKISNAPPNRCNGVANSYASVFSLQQLSIHHQLPNFIWPIFEFCHLSWTYIILIIWNFNYKINLNIQRKYSMLDFICSVLLFFLILLDVGPFKGGWLWVIFSKFSDPQGQILAVAQHLERTKLWFKAHVCEGYGPNHKAHTVSPTVWLAAFFN